MSASQPVTEGSADLMLLNEKTVRPILGLVKLKKKSMVRSDVN